MAIVHTEAMPKHKGESELAQRLSKIADDRLHLWFSLDFIPGVRDIDILAIHQDIGAFVIEVKAVPLNMIRTIGYQHCEIDGRELDRGPSVQAYAALQSLRNFLKPRARRFPFAVATTCWPTIHRESWNRHWDDPDIAGAYADSSLFREDVESVARVFTDRLCHIYANPPIRSGSSPRPVNDEVINEIDKALSPQARPRPTISDLARLQAIEKNVSKDILKKAPANEGVQLLLRGHPGTGKTFRLIQIGLAHAYAGVKVLFICYNKTLGADIRRLLSYVDRLRLTEHPVDVYDVFQFASEYASGEDLDYDPSMTHDAWGQLVVDAMQQAKKDGILEQYGTVLVDEAQDMESWQLELAGTLRRDRGTFCVAVGRGQELYGDGAAASGWLANFSATKTVQMGLNRNFRNTSTGFRFAWCFSQAYPDPKKINDAVRKLADPTTDLKFDRDVGGGPKLEVISEANLPARSDACFGLFQQELMVAEFLRIIRAEYDELIENQNNRPIDLLLLVPDTDGAHTNWIRLALMKFNGLTGIGFTDYVSEESRRSIAPDDKIRLCTFHSSRGLEGARVIIFGLEKLPILAANIQINEAKLGYVVLSRALFDMTIVRSQEVSNRLTGFIDEELYALSRAP